ncbi:pentatricopeptide repeat-containing protein At1g09220, mitochondrial-like [Herrania umbratica]|uniref:Pentatricopeptide repeat-containing protein At1g09220, mitochondrial-like n=1 Tax=Herrania umbratica TaxID=108875 RepID=A0A6J1A7M0_9ROSI|nr:pentatricopeptide repeat-containing protein At1g09220, mitochondrial-like [Herrania umbratica]
MLKLTKPPFPSKNKISQRFLHSFPSSSPTESQLSLSPQHKQNYQKYFLFSFLNKNPTNLRVPKQVHSHLLTTASISHSLRLFNALLRCYSFSENPNDAIFLYQQVQSCYLYLKFDSFTYAFLIKACANLNDVVLGKQFHGVEIKMGFESHPYVQTGLVNMYVESGGSVECKKVFDEMPDKNRVTWNVMITGLAKQGDIEFARFLFEKMPDRDIVSWSGMIDGYTRMNQYRKALGLFRRMVVDDVVEPSYITVLAILPAVWNIGDIKMCRLIHGYGEKRGFHVSDIRIMNSFIDTYAKCGCMMSALRFFEEISADMKNLISWTSLISGFALHGMGKEAVESFQRMEQVGWKPNRVTFLSVLNACSHGGLVEEGLKFFEKMVNECQILPGVKHYGCLVDMLGRAGRLEEAERIALEIPREIASDVVWRILLGACSFYGNVEVGERVTTKIMEIERGYGGDYVLMSNILAGAGRFRDAESLRRLMDERNTIKVPGSSLV